LSSVFTKESFKPGLHVLLALTAVLAGCTHTGKPHGNDAAAMTTDVRIEQQAHADPFAFARDFPRLSAEAQRTEINRLNQTASDPYSRLLLAMAYGLPGTATRDIAKAQTLLEEIVGNEQLDQASQSLAAIMRDYLGELSRSSQRLREEQKRADAIQSRLDDLQKKLDDLKNIEKTMVDRDQGIRK
jgi:hypothetical protein